MKSESEVAQSCLTLGDPKDCSLPGSSIHGIFQARVLEWGAIAFSEHPGQHLVYCISVHTLQFWPLNTSQIPVSQRNRLLFKKFHGNWWVELGNERQSGRSSDQPIYKRCLWSFPGGLDGKKNPSATQEIWVWSLGWEDPLEKGMATHSSILTWRILMVRDWWATVHGVAKSQAWLSDFHFTCSAKEKHALKPLAKYMLA